MTTVLRGLLASVVLALVLAACGDDGPTPEATAIRVAVTPPAKSATGSFSAEEATPTPVPLEDRRAVLEFARGHAATAGTWEGFHVDFDEWRAGLVVCEAAPIRVTLAQFADQLSGITAEARKLPRDGSVRELSEAIIAAVQQEEGALRTLRDGWRPNDPMVFEGVEEKRSAASAARRQVQDGLSDLIEKTSPASRAQVAAFSLELNSLTSAWDRFHQSYDTFRAEEPGLTSADAVRRLGELVDELRALVETVRELPTSEITREVAAVLSQAAQGEDLALRQLRSSFGGPSDPDGGQAATDGESASVDQTGGEGRDADLFSTFDAHLVEANRLRLDAALALADVVGETAEADGASAEAFASAYGLLGSCWDDFHRAYDEWRASEGGCDRTAAVATLGQFVVRFGALARDVRELPQVSVLRPVAELLIEAAEREEQAVRDLRDGWHPFDPQVYDGVELERNESRRLRRQVSAGVQDLIDQYDISDDEIGGEASGGG